MNLDTLDTMTAPELHAFCNETVADCRAAARRLFPHRPRGYLRATQVLALYAHRKANAIESRLAGLIENALSHEEQCEELFAMLPRFARW